MPIFKKEVAGVILFNTELDVLVLRKTRNGRWDLPKGQTEPGESLLHTAVRECYEETGLDPGIGQYLIVPNSFIDLESKSFVRFYLGIAEGYPHRGASGPHIELSDEHELYYWLDLDSAIEAFEVDGNPDFADAIKAISRLLEEDQLEDPFLSKVFTEEKESWS